jgi:catechol 2,3-dioxygenase-like lactoylglutathione lyase family enzyme
VTSYNAKRRYTPNVDKAERTSDLYREIFELRQVVKNFEAERDRLRGSLALFEAELAKLQKYYDGACLEIQRITGGI